MTCCDCEYAVNRNQVWSLMEALGFVAMAPGQNAQNEHQQTPSAAQVLSLSIAGT